MDKQLCCTLPTIDNDRKAQEWTCCAFILLLLSSFIIFWVGLGHDSLQQFQLQYGNIYDCTCSQFETENTHIYLDCNGNFGENIQDPCFTNNPNYFGSFIFEFNIISTLTFAGILVFSCIYFPFMIKPCDCCDTCVDRIRDVCDMVLFAGLIILGLFWGIYYVWLSSYMYNYNKSDTNICVKLTDCPWEYVPGSITNGKSIKYWLISGILTLLFSVMSFIVVLFIKGHCNKPYKTCPECHGTKMVDTLSGIPSCDKCYGSRYDNQQRQCTNPNCNNGYTIIEKSMRKNCIECLGTGKIKTQYMDRAVNCKVCGGRGCFAEKETNSRKCNTCKGKGYMLYQCTKCRGSGKYGERRVGRATCDKCNGRGINEQKVGICCRVCFRKEKRYLLQNGYEEIDDFNEDILTKVRQ